MAVFTLTNASVTVAGTNLSDHVTSVTIDTGAEEVDTTAMSASGWKTNTAGLKNWSVQINFQQDYAASKVDATIWPLLGTNVTVDVISDAGSAISATNPSYTGSVLVNSYSPVAGSVGELATTEVTWPGSGALVRATS